MQSQPTALEKPRRVWRFGTCNLQLHCPMVPISSWSYFRCSDSGAYLLLFESCSSTAATRRILSLDFWSANFGLASKFQSWLLWVLLKKKMKNAGPTDAYCTCSVIFQKCIAKYHFRLLIFQPLEKIISFLVIVVLCCITLHSITMSRGTV